MAFYNLYYEKTHEARIFSDSMYPSLLKNKTNFRVVSARGGRRASTFSMEIATVIPSIQETLKIKKIGHLLLLMNCFFTIYGPNPASVEEYLFCVIRSSLYQTTTVVFRDQSRVNSPRQRMYVHAISFCFPLESWPIFFL